MSKPRIIIQHNSNHTLHKLLQQYVDLVVYDPAVDYSMRDMVLVNLFADNWWQTLYEKGHRIVLDNLAEPYNQFKKIFPILNSKQYYVMHNANWFWYAEARQLAQERCYTPVKTYQKLVLMPINFKKNHRVRLFDAMQPYLKDCVYSFAELGIYLPGDQVDKFDKDPSWDRYFDAAWYNDTYFTLAAETWTDNVQEYARQGNYPNQDLWGGLGQYIGPYPFVTEKTMKPIAHQHPFMIFGQSNTLAHLHALGFETYENLFDESYDQIDNSDLSSTDKKLNRIMQNVHDFERKPYDHVTLEKIRHNYAHYTNLELISQRVKHEIIDPLLEYYSS